MRSPLKKTCFLTTYTTLFFYAFSLFSMIRIFYLIDLIALKAFMFMVRFLTYSMFFLQLFDTIHKIPQT